MRNSIILIPVLIILASFGCNNPSNSHGHTHDVIGGHDATDEPHAHGDERKTLSYTLFKDNYELFVEFPAMVTNHKSDFAAHFTDLSNYKPILKGTLTVKMVKGNNGIRHRVEQPSRPGIFTPALVPKSGGTYDLTFELNFDSQTHTFQIQDVQVFEDIDMANNSISGEGGNDEVVFLKEQAWKTDFETIEINPRKFHSVIATSGVVRSDPGSTFTHNAQIKGSVSLYKVMGESVKNGDLLAVIKDDAIIDNLSTKLTESKITYDRSKLEYDRSLPLLEKQLISKKEFLDIQSRFRRDSLNYYQMANNVSLKGVRLFSRTDGYVSQIYVSNGQFVDFGSSVITISNDRRLLIEAKVNQSDLSKVKGIYDANFKYSEEGEVLQLSEMNGKVVTQNAFVDQSTNRIPILFSVTGNGKLVPGMYIEVFLKCSPIDEAIVVPVSAIIEEQGLYYVFVQQGGESYEKREIIVGGNDGDEIQVLSGLFEGERIVTKGAYQIKLASLAGDLPLHGHTH